MRLSVNWLKDYIDPKLSTDNLVDRLTMAGLDVEAIEVSGKDTVLEIEITPNRSDCLSILGLAREIGAITGKVVKYPKIKSFKTASLKSLIHIENKRDCRRYIGTLIRDVYVHDAPPEMKQRLASLGIPAINNAVDVTNFVLMETGQPLHAFDYDKLTGGKISVRRARAGETITTIDGIERKLDPSILVIADTKKPVAIAGIMGGKDTEITADTKNILLESAHFDMGLIRRSSRALGLRSDSSYRFERDVNFEGILTAANRATDLLLQLTGGRLSGRGEMAAQAPSIAAKIKVKISDIESLLGTKITYWEVKRWLSGLGFNVATKGDILMLRAPAHRVDIQEDVDVIEEIARMIGFDRLPSQLPMIKTTNIPVDKKPYEIKNHIRRILTAGGMNEIITLSTISNKASIKSEIRAFSALRISNPLNQDQEIMRPNMLMSFLQVAATNINRGQKDLRFFEIGKAYLREGEIETLAILLTGHRFHDWRLSKKEEIEIFDLKGALERIFQNLGLSHSFKADKMSPFNPACAGTILVDERQIGTFGKIDQKVLDNWDIKHQDVYFAEVHLDEILSMSTKIIKYQPVSEFPAIVRDVSLAVKKEIPYQEIEDICRRQGGGILRSVHFMEQYLGDKIPSGHRGVVFSCHYQSNARTLREDEVTAAHERILQALKRDLGAIRR